MGDIMSGPRAANFPVSRGRGVQNYYSVLDCVVFAFLSWQFAAYENDDTIFKRELEKEDGEFQV